VRHEQGESPSDYHGFVFLDGKHPWQDLVQEGYILYPVRMLNQGKILYFNFDLGKEMGLLPIDHPHRVTKGLERKLIETFSLRIVNEYDQKRNVQHPPRLMKKNPFMATRYLQLQHADKCGRTSGDGRSIWNGCVEHKGVMWDVSSRGTGVTALAPGSVAAGRPLPSGNTDHGYGCGLADIDELVASAIQAEIFHKNGINTERVLCVIDLGDATGIGVRAAKNLIRPAHLFSFLKQSRLDPLRKSVEYLIQRQCRNKDWDFDPKGPRRYDQMLEKITESFAHFAAQLDREYIFAWLDWDGDNVLSNAGIIDYGSIRLLGLCHDNYRYDDVERFSTNLNEQRKKAKQIVQVFAQLIEFVKTGQKMKFNDLGTHPQVRRFDRLFNQNRIKIFLGQLGFSKSMLARILLQNRQEANELFRAHMLLERIKTRRKASRVPDGVNRPAILNMRRAIVEINSLILNQGIDALSKTKDEKIFKMMLANSARGLDRRITNVHRRRIARFIRAYIAVLALLPKAKAEETFRRANQINSQSRLTGDGLLHVTDRVLREWKHTNKNQLHIQKVIDTIVRMNIAPDVKARGTESLKTAKDLSPYIRLIDAFKESI